MTRPTKERVEQAIAGHYGYEHCRVLGKDDDVCVLAAEVRALWEELEVFKESRDQQRDRVHVLRATLGRVEALPEKWRGKACGALTNANTFTIVALELEAALKGEP